MAETMAQHIKRTWQCDVTANGVAYEWGYAGPGGAYFVLLREPQHTEADVAEAKRLLRADRDVVSLRVVADYPREG